MMGIDGTCAACIMEDVSETGAKLTVEGSVEGCISRSASCCCRPPTHRRCELAWVNGDKSASIF
jgi:hypothetical protein